VRLLEHLQENAPFVAAATAVPVKWSTQRIVEAIIIGVIAALGSTYVTTKVLDEKVSQVEKRLSQLEDKTDRRYESLQEDLRRIYAVLVQERPQRRTER
jgi:phosphate/sulfate permease